MGTATVMASMMETGTMPVSATTEIMLTMLHIRTWQDLVGLIGLILINNKELSLR